jgi:hypothetical protein
VLPCTLLARRVYRRDLTGFLLEQAICSLLEVLAALTLVVLLTSYLVMLHHGVLCIPERDLPLS